MWHCRRCDANFETPDSKRELASSDPVMYIPFGVCPYCGSDDYVKAVECKECGDWYDEDVLIGGICKDCLAEAMNNIDLLKDYLEASEQIEDFAEWVGDRDE